MILLLSLVLTEIKQILPLVSSYTQNRQSPFKESQNFLFFLIGILRD